MGFVAVSLMVVAQNDAALDYNKFRSQILADYDAYKKAVLDEYATYLDGVWQEYQAMTGPKKDDTPKPATPPVVPLDERIGADATPPVTPRTVDVNQRQEPIPVVKPVSTHSVPVAKPVAGDEKPRTGFDVPNRPLPSKSTTQTVSNTPQCNVSFYNQMVTLPIIDEDLSGVTVQNLGAYWSKLQKNRNMETLVRGIESAAALYGLNDWLTFKLAESYAMQYKSGNSEVAQTLVTQYLASHLGFDVRLARSGSEALLLIPFKQMVYECNYVTLNSEKLYIYAAGQFLPRATLSTCEMPDDAKLGTPLDLAFSHELNMNGPKRSFNVSYGGITLTGQVDLTQMEIVGHYPQMAVVEYAKSLLDRGLRDDICSQVRSQLNDLTKIDAVNKLLAFVQFGFEYATDDVQHGHEKPYFFEELFYYPKCDCEDRSLFLAYLLREALDIDNVLVRFPGHECVAVLIKEYSGDGFLYNDNRYTIADPTYMGAKMGQCMTNFKAEKPIVEDWY